MSLTPGTRVGPYDIVLPLGAGGMGEVYRARDTKLNRDVAIKILPEAFALDRERRARFEREAQVLASLNHPNIAQIHGFEESGEVRALVMELVEGEDLAQRIARGAIPLDEALVIAKQIAEALEAAHERGVVHRDLKPANIKVTPDGTVKVLDFGLAKDASEVPADLTQSPTITSDGTRAGVILGTAAYMSPEQARGRAVDKRTDIWAFGCVVYEMLTGRRAFAGETVPDVIAAVLGPGPDWNALPAAAQPSLRRLLPRLLEKDVKHRIRDIGDVRFDLDEALSGDAAVVTSAQRSARVLTLAAIVGAAVLATLAAAGAWMLKPDPVPPVVRFTIPLGPQEQLRAVRQAIAVVRQAIAVAPDGSALAITAGRGIMLRRLGDFAATPLPNTDGAWAMTFSADSTSLLFWTAGEIKRLDLNGGAPQRIAAVPAGGPGTGPNGLAWAVDGTIAYQSDGSITLLGPDGNAKVLRGVSGQAPALPHFLPDGRALLYATTAPGTSSIALHVLDGSDPITLLQGTAPQFVPPNQLLFTRAGSLYSVFLDVSQRRVAGEPRLVIDGILVGGAAMIPHYGVSRTGDLYFLPGGSALDLISLVTVRPKTEPLTLDAPQRSYSDLRLSPDRTRLAMHLADQENDIWIRDMARGTLTRFTFGRGEDESPVWSPDGARLAYASDREEDKGRTIRMKRSDGTGEETVLWRAPSHSHVTDWSRDGRWLVLDGGRSEREHSDIMLLDLKDPQAPKTFLRTPFHEASGRISPDGKWLAYMSNESGANEIYLQSFPDGGNKVQVSLSGGTAPVWSHDGSRLFYRAPGGVMAVSVTLAPKLAISSPQNLFADIFGKLQGDTHTSYDVARDGSFLFTRQIVVGGGSQVVVHGVLNWLTQLQ